MQKASKIYSSHSWYFRRFCYLFLAFLFICFITVLANPVKPHNKISMSGDTVGSEIFSWRFQTQDLEEGVKKFELYAGHHPAPFLLVIEALRNRDRNLITLLSDAIRNYNSPAIFWECKPITPNKANSTGFEFVLLPAAPLSSRRVDITAFGDQFKQFSCVESSEYGVIQFSNLGRDAVLVVPCPPRNADNQLIASQYMTHLASFIREADVAHVHNLWQTIGNAWYKVLSESTNKDKQVWVSTSGLGVSWLHVRFDSFPKYYNWKDYKISHVK